MERDDRFLERDSIAQNFVDDVRAHREAFLQR
jgi:hypothetical protein